MDELIFGIGVSVLLLGQFIFWRYASIGDGNDIPPFGLLISLIGGVLGIIGYIR